MKALLKGFLNCGCMLLVLPLAAIAGFGRFTGLFRFGAQMYSLVPGLPGDYLRTAFYKLTLKACSLDSRVSFGSFFSHPDAEVGDKVYIGAYCILGRCSIGARTQIASHVQVLSGRYQHKRDSSGQISGSDKGVFHAIEVGSDCWIGASSIIMASVGSGTTIGAGAVVVKPVGSGVVAVGNPARIISEQC
jgi:virginiamycin A acetyltransferase